MRLRNYRNKFGIYYHIFADNKDYYEDSFKKANDVYRKLKSDGESNIRLYQCWYNSIEDAVSLYDCCENETCLKSIGEFPQ